MLAVLAFLLALFAGLGAHVGSVSAFDLACFALASLALHFARVNPRFPVV